MQRPMGQATVEWYLKQHPRCFLMFPIANFMQIYLTDCFGYNYWSSWCQSLFSINSRYIRNQKAGRFILVLVHPKVPWCAYTCWNLWEPPPCLFNLSCDQRLNIDWYCLVLHCIMRSRDRWEFPPFFRPPWPSLCTAVTATIKIMNIPSL